MQSKQKNKNKRAVVKSIDRERMQLVLLGPTGDKGYYQEKRVYIHCISYVEDPKLQRVAFDLLRRRLVGQKVEFDDYKIGKAVNADIFLDKKNIGFEMVSKGLAKAVRCGEKTSKYYEDLKAAQKMATQAGLGWWADEDEEGNEMTKKQRRQAKRAKKLGLTDLIGVDFNGYVESLEFNMIFKVWSETHQMSIEAKLASVVVPVVKKDHVIKLKNWMSKNMFQRDSKFQVVSVEEGIAMLLETEGSLTEQMVAEGWARLDGKAASEMPGEVFGQLRELESKAQTKGTRIWKGWKKKDRGKVIKSAKWPLKKRIDVKVIEVHNGDSITVKEKGGETLRMYLSNVRAPRYRWEEGENNPPWAFEAREFTRSSLIKKEVGLEMDVRKIIKKETDSKEIEITAGTIFLDDKPFAVELLEKGFAELNVKKGSEDVSSCIKSYAVASEKAKKKKNGIFNRKYLRKAFWDYSIPENKKKLRMESNISEGETLAAVVERCMSSTRFKLRLDSKNCFIIFSLNGLRAVRGNKNMSSLEKWADKGKALAIDLIAQRDVRIEIVKIDKAGTCHGDIYVKSKNYGFKTLKEGVAYLDTSFGRVRGQDALQKLQDMARTQKKGLWRDESVVMALGLASPVDDDADLNDAHNLGEIADTKSDARKRKPKAFKAELTECESADNFYIARTDSPQARSISKGIRDYGRKSSPLSDPIDFGTLCLGRFNGEFYRCRVVSKAGKSAYRVFFLDFGNYSAISLANLKTCPSKIMAIPPQARCVALAHVRVPNCDQEFGPAAVDLIQTRLMSKSFKVEIKGKDKYGSQVVIYLKDSEDVRDTLNFQIVQRGLALPDSDDQEVKGSGVWAEAYEAALKKNPGLVSVLDEEQEQ